MKFTAKALLNIRRMDMTNYERIKAMSVEEMVEFLYGDCAHCAFIGEACYRDP